MTAGNKTKQELIAELQALRLRVAELERSEAERQQMEESLSASEEKYRSLFQNMRSGYAFCKMFFDAENKPVDFIYIDVNDTFEQLTGLRREDVIGKRVTEAIPGIRELNPEIIPIYGEVVLTGRPAAFEVFFAPLGMWLALSVYRPRPDHFVAVFDNITERKQVEKLLQTVFESSPVGIYIVQDGKIQLVNPQLTKLTGYSQAELLGKKPQHVVLAEDRRRVRASAVQTLRGESSSPYEYRLVDKEGKVKWVMETVTSIQYQGKRAVMGSYMDITEHKQAEKALEAQKELTARILASTPNAILVIDSDLDIVLANQAFCRIFRVEKAEVEGKQFTDVLCMEGLAEAVTRALLDRQFQPGLEFRCETENGAMILLTQITPMAEEEVLLILLDVTAERAHQEQLYHIDRLASIGEVAAAVAHELNNPLAGVLGYSELLLSQEVPQDVKSDVEVIHRNAQRAVTIVRNLLAFARRQEPQKQRLSINDTIRHMLEMRDYDLKVSNIEVITELAAGLPEVLADPQQLEQVFLNIILNAEQAMLEAHNRGTLTIQTKVRRGMVSIILSDDGPGIPAANLWRVFTPFFTTKEPGKSTGLGLSICHGIVTEHGGRIYAESVVGEGATFFVELPVAEEKKG